MSFFGSLFGTDKAADAIKSAQKKNIKEANSTYGDISGMYSPYVQQGTAATGTIANLLGFNGSGAQQQAIGNYQMSPDFQVRYQTGLDAIDRSALGKYNSLNNGNVLKAITNYGQEQGQLGYNDYFNKLLGQEQIGFQGTTGTANARTGQSTAIQNANSAIGQGEANAALANGALLMGGINTLAGLAGMGMGGGGFGANLFRPTATTGRVQTPLMMNTGGTPYYW